MKKITLSFQLMAAIIAVTILQVCAGTAAAGTCAQPTLNPLTKSGFSTVSVYIETATSGASLVYTLSGSGAVGGIIRNRTGTVTITVPTGGRTVLSVVAIKSGYYDSPTATGTYTN
jgi:hypothetical protein